MIQNGIDLVEIDRIRLSLESPAFLQKVFGEHERVAFLEHGLRAESAAGAFAAKEAFSKALGTGIRGFSLKEVEVLHDQYGAPYFLLSGKAAAIAAEQNLDFALSITHTKDYAAAVVTAFGKETDKR